MKRFKEDRLKFLWELSRDYGPIASFRLAHRRVFLVSDPNLIEQVLVTDAKYYIKHFGARAYKAILGNGLVTSEGELWRRQRRLCNPVFREGPVHSHVPVMTELTDRMLGEWAPGKSINVDYEFIALAAAVALKTLFDLDDPGDRKRFADTVRLAVELIAARIRQIAKFPLWFPTPGNLRLRSAVAELNRVVDGFIAAGRARPHTDTREDLLSRLLSAQLKDGTGMSPRQLRDEAMTLYVSAHETTSLAIAWTWYLISQNPQVEEKLVTEWRRVLGGRPPTAEDLSALPYTAAVITESMRIYPPVPLIGREATTDLKLGGYRVKRGYTVFMCPWVSHRDRKYFPDPEAFRPERWQDGLAKRIPRFAYYPFSGGKRGCIGEHFAKVEATIALTMVGQKFRFTCDAESEIKLNPGLITLKPEQGIPATLKLREMRGKSATPQTVAS